MENLRTSMRLTVLIVVVVSLSFTYMPATAATSETYYLPAVQLSALQSAQVAVSNHSTEPVDVKISIYGATGNVVSSTSQSITPNHTYVLRFANGNAVSDYYAVVTASATGTISTDLQALASNGEVAAITFPFANSVPAVQNTPMVRLVPGQSAAVVVINVGTETTTFDLTVYNNNGNVVLSKEGIQIGPGQIENDTFSNDGEVNNGYRATVSDSARRSSLSEIITLDRATGKVLTIVYPPDPCAQ